MEDWFRMPIFTCLEQQKDVIVETPFCSSFGSWNLRHKNKLLNHQLHLFMETLRIKYGFNVKDLQVKFCSQESISSRFNVEYDTITRYEKIIKIK